jgi:hypothetical protein
VTIARLTGSKREARCLVCGRVVEQREHAFQVAGQAGEKKGWMPVHHEAPCGLPCLGGGVCATDLKALRERRQRPGDGVHGWSGKCQRCGDTAVNRGTGD